MTWAEEQDRAEAYLIQQRRRAHNDQVLAAKLSGSRAAFQGLLERTGAAAAGTASFYRPPAPTGYQDTYEDTY